MCALRTAHPFSTVGTAQYIFVLSCKCLSECFAAGATAARVVIVGAATAELFCVLLAPRQRWRAIMGTAS